MPASLKAKTRPTELRKFRQDRHLTWQEMADIFGVSMSCYAHWERGEAPVSRHAEQALKNWKTIVSMGEAILDLDDEGRAFLESLDLSPVLMAEIIRRKEL